jgi:hypothetical protein
MKNEDSIEKYQCDGKDSKIRRRYHQMQQNRQRVLEK